MPLSELFRLATGKLESSQKKPCPSGNSSRGEDDLVELVWENGQVKMQNQSSMATRNPVLPFCPNRVCDAEAGHGLATRIGKSSGVQSIFDDISPVPLGELDLSQDDDIVPWIKSYPMGNALAQGFGSELLTGMSGVTAVGVSTQRSFASADKRSSTCDRAVGILQSGGNGNCVKASSSSTASVLCSLPSLSGSLDIISRNNANTKVEMAKNVRMPNNNSNLVNFSHFSRPIALASSKLPASDGIPTPVSSGVDRVQVKEMGSSAKLVPADCKQLDTRATEEPSAPERIENVRSEIKNNGTAEPVAASSSVCSGNGANREKMHYSKRKFCDIEDSECRSDDFETESTGVTKPAPARGGSGSKRSRAAEVHNLSERRRRDRINEKMRALQELIPNCSKVDKASMLDEAIEYLKTLQLQVQIMSMGTGVCVPPMMFPTGMQHIPPQVPHFSPMGVGMGYGMGMPDINGRIPRCPIFPIPPQMQQAGFFPSPVSGLNNFQRVPAPSLSVYGHHDQVLHSSVPRAPVVPLTGQPHIDSAMGSTGFRNRSRNEVPSASPTFCCGDPKNKKNSGSMLDAGASNSGDHKPIQACAYSAEVEENNGCATDVRDPADRASTTPVL